MSTITLALVLLLLTTAVAAATADLPTAGTRHVAPATVLVLHDFTATVYHGPDTGLSLRGTLTLRDNRAGGLAGQLARQHAPAVPVSGQLTGLAINLVFYLGHGQHIFGVGTFGQDPGARGGFVGGPLVGPNKADAGDWFADDDQGSGANVAHGSQFGD
jgi:hypothetical protein